MTADRQVTMSKTRFRYYLYGRSRANRWPLWVALLLAPTPHAKRTVRELIKLKKQGINV